MPSLEGNENTSSNGCFLLDLIRLKRVWSRLGVGLLHDLSHAKHARLTHLTRTLGRPFFIGTDCWPCQALPKAEAKGRASKLRCDDFVQSGRSSLCFVVDALGFNPHRLVNVSFPSGFH